LRNAASDALGARAQHQVIGVAEENVCAGEPYCLRQQALDGRLRADRHEGRRRYRAVRGGDLAAARSAVGGEKAEPESRRHRS